MYLDINGRARTKYGFKYERLDDLIVHRRLSMIELPHSHGGNTGSNPVGDASYLDMLREIEAAR